MRDEEVLAEIEDFIEGFNQPTYRGMRINGVRVPRGHPAMDGLAIRGLMRSGFTEPLRQAHTAPEAHWDSSQVRRPVFATAMADRYISSSLRLATIAPILNDHGASSS